MITLWHFLYFIVGISFLGLISYIFSDVLPKRKKQKQAKLNYEKGKTEFDNKNYKEAFELFSQAMHLEFNKTQCQYYLGRIYLHQKTYYKAVNIFDDILKEIPNYRDINFYNAIAKQMVGDYSSAQKSFKRYYDQNDTDNMLNIISHYEYGIIETKLNNDIQAQSYFDKAREYAIGT